MAIDKKDEPVQEMKLDVLEKAKSAILSMQNSRKTRRLCWFIREGITSRVKFLNWMIKELKVTSLYGPYYL